MTRIPYFDPANASPEVLEELEKLPHLKHMNLTRTIAQADSIFVYYLGFGGRLLTQLALDTKLIELAILLVSTRTEADYVWNQHSAIALAVGVPQDQIAAVRAGQLTAGCLEGGERAVLAFSAAVLASPRIDEDTFAAAREFLSPREIVELLLVIGNYFMIGRLATVLEVDPDDALGGLVIDEANTKLNRR